MYIYRWIKRSHKRKERKRNLFRVLCAHFVSSVDEIKVLSSHEIHRLYKPTNKHYFSVWNCNTFCLFRRTRFVRLNEIRILQLSSTRMNGSKMLAFYFEYYECVVIFLPFRFICNCGHRFPCLVSLRDLREAVSLVALFSSHSKNIVCGCLGIPFLSSYFYP